MGCLHYGPKQVFLFDDRLLAHLRTVITNKLLRQESFLFTWNESQVQRSIWLHPTSNLEFEFESTTPLRINRVWVDELSALANGASGLHLVAEPDEHDEHGRTAQDSSAH